MSDASSKTTTDRKEIQKWAEARQGRPATVDRPGPEDDNEVSVLRIDFPGYSGNSSLREITWDEFFDKFEERELAFLYQEKTKDGEESRFFKLVKRDGAANGKNGHKVEHKAEHKAEHKTEHKADHKPEHKTEHKAERKAEHKADHKTEHKTEHKADHKTEHKTEHKAEKAGSKK